MPLYKVVNKATGNVDFVYNNDVPIEWAGSEFVTHDHIEVILPPPPVPIPVPQRVTKLGFRNRFTNTEKVTIELASMDNPSLALSHPSRQLAASLRVYLEDLANATFIDLTRPETIAGVNTLEQYGLIGVGRAAIILTSPILESEAYLG
jgi:hypothetical protein